jgi:hypothetical protein
MKTIILLTILLFMAAFMPISATIINIPDDYPTIQEGIDASTDGDTVLVQPGTYVENINFNGHNIVLGSLFLTTGDTTYIAETIIDGDSSGTVVTFENGETSTAVISGFTIKDGLSSRGGGIFCEAANPTIRRNYIVNNFVYYEWQYGGAFGAGVFCLNSHANVLENYISSNREYDNVWSYGGGLFCGENSGAIILNNHISNNGVSYGGGIYIISANPVLINNIISGNTSSGGGGIFCSGSSSPIIKGNSIIGNHAWRGGGIFSYDSEIRIDGNYICQNISRQGGGILCESASSLQIANNIIVNNQLIFPDSVLEYGYGAGIYCCWSAEIIVVNNVIVGNEIDRRVYIGFGGGIYCEGNPTVTINNTILRDNTADDGPEIYGEPIVIFSDIQGGWEGEGNIDVDPLFRNPENGDFHLMSTACGDPHDSPCIDAGHPDILDSLLDCSWGLGELRSDMGAYGGGDSVMVGIDQDDILVPHEFSLLQNYPNPFNAATIIRYALPEPSEVKIEIFDILGRKVETLVDENQQAGYHQIMWNAEDKTSGIYLYRIQAGSLTETKKMLLLR